MKPLTAILIIASLSIIAITSITVYLMIYHSIWWGLLGLLLIGCLRIKYSETPYKCPKCGYEEMENETDKC